MHPCNNLCRLGLRGWSAEASGQCHKRSPRQICEYRISLRPHPVGQSLFEHTGFCKQAGPVLDTGQAQPVSGSWRMAAGRRRSARSRGSEGLCPSRIAKTAQRSASGVPRPPIITVIGASGARQPAVTQPVDQDLPLHFPNRVLSVLAVIPGLRQVHKINCFFTHLLAYKQKVSPLDFHCQN
jgi:hypothetical protein